MSHRAAADGCGAPQPLDIARAWKVVWQSGYHRDAPQSQLISAGTFIQKSAGAVAVRGRPPVDPKKAAVLRRPVEAGMTPGRAARPLRSMDGLLPAPNRIS